VEDARKELASKYKSTKEKIKKVYVEKEKLASELSESNITIDTKEREILKLKDTVSRQLVSLGSLTERKDHYKTQEARAKATVSKMLMQNHAAEIHKRKMDDRVDFTLFIGQQPTARRNGQHDAQRREAMAVDNGFRTGSNHLPAPVPRVCRRNTNQSCGVDFGQYEGMYTGAPLYPQQDPFSYSQVRQQSHRHLFDSQQPPPPQQPAWQGQEPPQEGQEPASPSHSEGTMEPFPGESTEAFERRVYGEEEDGQYFE
jgi:hypothetical protein